MDKPVNLVDIRFSDKGGKLIVREEYNLIFNSYEIAEVFIQDRTKYWKELLKMDLVIAPYQNDTIEEIEIQKVFKLTAKAMGISSRYVLHKTRSDSIIEVRRIAIAICLDYGLSEAIIGKAISKDRTTIIHHRDKFYGFCENEPGYEDRFTEIKDKVKKKLGGEFLDDGSGEKLK